MTTSEASAPIELRWGIIGTGLIASWFVSDLVRDPASHRNEPCIKHFVQAIGSSSHEKAKAFAEKHVPVSTTPRPSLYDKYDRVYQDPDVDIVYIATPHTFHLQNTLDAINAGKHVLCEKPIALTAIDAEKMVSAARAKGVFLMEGVWTRFFPVARELQRLLHVERAIGEPNRAFFDFGLNMPLNKQPAGSRVADPKLGAGALLDIGIYPLTWARMLFHSDLGSDEEQPVIVSNLIFNEGVDELSTMVLGYPKHAKQAICTASYLHKSGRMFGRIEGTEGSIEVLGRATSRPDALVVKRTGEEEKVLDLPTEGWGFFYEADAVAKDIAAGKKESDIMSLHESVNVMRIMDEVRKQNGLTYPQEA